MKAELSDDGGVKVHKIGIKLRDSYYICMLMFGGQNRKPTSLIDVEALCISSGETIRFEQDRAVFLCLGAS